MGFSAAVSNSDHSQIYIFNSYAQLGIEYPQFIILDSNSGILVSSVYSFLLTWPSIFKMEIKESRVYTLAYWISIAYFIVYDTSTATFEFYGANNVITLRLNDFIFEINTDR